MTEFPAGRGPRFPPLAGSDLQGRPVRVPPPGRVSVVNVWGSWCTPCRDKAPVLAGLAAEFVGGVDFRGIDTRDLDRPAGDFEDEFGIG